MFIGQVDVWSEQRPEVSVRKRGCSGRPGCTKPGVSGKCTPGTAVGVVLSKRLSIFDKPRFHAYGLPAAKSTASEVVYLPNPQTLTMGRPSELRCPHRISFSYSSLSTPNCSTKLLPSSTRFGFVGCPIGLLILFLHHGRAIISTGLPKSNGRSRKSVR